MKKLVIVTFTYNQEDYIEEALKSIVMQKTNFPFEVIVADDCSTDNTRKIIDRYAKKYPEIVKKNITKKMKDLWKTLYQHYQQ